MSMDSDPMPAPVTADDNVWVDATINSVMPDHSMVNVTHQAVAEWAWPAMTMDFHVDPSVNIGDLGQGMTLQLQITRTPDRQFRISAVRLPDEAPGDAQGPGQPMQEMNQEKTDPDQMDHSQMDHSQMDHEPVDHSAHQGDGSPEPDHD
jgi:Cu(I)/Ag(I) efflux system membrane fusion protein